MTAKIKRLARPKRESKNVSFRLGREQHAVLMARVEQSGLSPRAWLERAILANETTIVARQKQHPNIDSLLFQLGRAGNNLNQIALRLNTLQKSGGLNQGAADHALELLDAVAHQLTRAIDRAR